MKKNFLKTTKTARYFTIGNLNRQTKIIYFVLHGYAQNADSFIKEFKVLEDENTVIIAPEALSRFYWKDFSSNPVSSWMTKLERESDIDDNINYLNNVYIEITKNININNISCNYIGFSQGSATLARWVHNDKIKVNNLFFYAGDLAYELKYSKSENFKLAKMHYIYGLKDFFIKPEKVEKIRTLLAIDNIKLKVFTFDGKHVVLPEALSYIKNKTK